MNEGSWDFRLSLALDREAVYEQYTQKDFAVLGLNLELFFLIVL